MTAAKAALLNVRDRRMRVHGGHAAIAAHPGDIHVSGRVVGGTPRCRRADLKRYRVRMLTPEELLTTTRSVRRRLDLGRAVPRELILECIDITTQAPTGSNRQQWQWLIVTDKDKRAFIGECYRKSWYRYASGPRPEYPPDDPRNAQQPRVVTSARYLADHMGEVPALVLACIEGRAEGQSNMAIAGLYGSIVPAAWSFMLAARLRGLGSADTTLHLAYEREVADVLRIPFETVTQAALLPVAYYMGETFQPAERVPLEQIVHWDTW
jgi:nitroreductase